jgi:Fe(3+) dicitrate transport protein
MRGNTGAFHRAGTRRGWIAKAVGVSVLAAFSLGLSASADDGEKPPAASGVEEVAAGTSENTTSMTGTSGAVESDPDGRSNLIEMSEVLLVTGGAAAVESVPGSGHFIGKLELERLASSDIHRVLQQVEGVNVQEEDGLGLRPNIGMRGTGVNRSEKITLLEDGVLIAPAPYAAPAAYYFPTSERMEAVEVRKGSSAISQGPYTTGGVLNLVSTSIPVALGGRGKLVVGSHGTSRAHAILGDSRERFGWLLEGYRLDSDGFKQLDGGGSTGVGLTDLHGKVRWQGSGDGGVYQTLELKVGKTDQLGEETYLGLTEADFARTPLRRYAASQEDFIDSEHDQLQIRYQATPATNLLVTATAYRNGFFRNWHKLQSVDGLGLGAVLDSPGGYPEQAALLAGAAENLDGGLAIRNNRRQYTSEGVEARVFLDVGGSRIEHEIEVGLRLHRDEEDRFQEEDLWNMVGGRMELFGLGVPGSQSNRISSAEAVALFVSDTVRIGSLTVTPGIRVERIDFEKLDYGKTDPLRIGTQARHSFNEANVVLPGIGLSYQLTESWNVIGGIHRGFSAPGPGQDPEVDAEESLNHELGFNFRSTTGEMPLGARVVGFFNDYDNLIGRDSLSTGGEGSARTFNGGEVSVLGLEAALDADLGSRFPALDSVPVRLGYTWTRAEFGSTFETSFSEWSPIVNDGDVLPNIPSQRASLSVGVAGKSWDTFVAASYTGEMRTRSGNGPNQTGEGIESHVVIDLSARLDLSRHLTALLQVRNLFDETYLASRRPAGLRPGLPQTVLVGLKWAS